MTNEQPLPNDHNPRHALRLTFFQTFLLAACLGTFIVDMAAALAPLTGPAGIAPHTPLNLRNPRVIVVKSARKLHLFDGDRLIRSYPVTLGPASSGQKRCAGDGRTPEGRYRICTKNAHSPNHRFLGIDYPDPAAARRGLRDGLISRGEARAIIDAHRENRCPVWTTALGGAIGLHGAARNGSTAGCIALPDECVEELFDVLRIGDHVEILP